MQYSVTTLGTVLQSVDSVSDLLSAKGKDSTICCTRELSYILGNGKACSHVNSVLNLFG